jgi:hypothetical protein
MKKLASVTFLDFIKHSFRRNLARLLDEGFICRYREPGFKAQKVSMPRLFWIESRLDSGYSVLAYPMLDQVIFVVKNFFALGALDFLDVRHLKKRAHFILGIKMFEISIE